MAEGTDGKGERIVFLDWLRAAAIFMVLVVHACEKYYFDDAGNTHIASAGDALWVTLLDSAGRASVPLFVMASSCLLFPLTRPTGAFFRRRLMRVLVPFVLWSVLYVAWLGGDWGRLLFNFPDAAGHLWFVPMIFGLYLLMPLLSPWAERVSEKEVRGWLLVWLFTTLFPYLRRIWGCWFGAPSFGAVSYLYGECPWNAFGTFQYVSGFFGYLLLGFWFRRFVPPLRWKATLVWALPLLLVGYAVTAGLFYARIPGEGQFPVTRPYAAAVELEMSWEFCSLGVAMQVAGFFLLLRKMTGGGLWYRRLVRPLSEASFGIYLMHMLILTPVAGLLRPALATPLAILSVAGVTFVVSALCTMILRRIPGIGRLLCG